MTVDKKSLTREQADAIYTLLVREAKANEDEREDFVDYFIKADDSREWRFRGALGFGGKCYSNFGRVWIGCYYEDRTPERVNREIKVILCK